METTIQKSHYFATEHYPASGRATGKVVILSKEEYNDQDLFTCGNYSCHEFDEEISLKEANERLIDVDEDGYTSLKPIEVEEEIEEVVGYKIVIVYPSGNSKEVATANNIEEANSQILRIGTGEMKFGMPRNYSYEWDSEDGLPVFKTSNGTKIKIVKS